MKKKHLLVFLFSMFTFIFLSACNSPTAINVKFKENEYVLSVDECMDFFDQFDANGKDSSVFDLISADPVILEEGEEGVFTAKNPGETYIKATYQGSIVAQVKVNVKYKFSSPTNFVINESGILTWSPSMISRAGKTETA